MTTTYIMLQKKKIVLSEVWSSLSPIRNAALFMPHPEIQGCPADPSGDDMLSLEGSSVD